MIIIAMMLKSSANGRFVSVRFNRARNETKRKQINKKRFPCCFCYCNCIWNVCVFIELN